MDTGLGSGLGVSNQTDKSNIGLEGSQEWLKFMESSKLVLKKALVNDPELEQFDLNERITKIYNYNVLGGKHRRGMLIVMAVKLFAEYSGIKITEDIINSARICGWALELLQGLAVVMDDIVDQSITRREKLCWYKKVGLTAINDALMLEQHVYSMLKEFISDKPYYIKVVESLHQVTLFSVYGQSLDLSIEQKDGRPDFKFYTRTRMNTIYKFKTSFYTFVLPVKIAMFILSIDSEEELKNIEKILFEIGSLFQLNDDYLDCYGDPNITGKIGTDIQDAKYCWPIVTALELCDENQLNILKTNYGNKSEECVNAVKEVYNQLNLTEVYKKETEQMYTNIIIEIDKLKDKSQLNPKLFTYILEKNFKRI